MQAWTVNKLGAPVDVMKLGERELPEPGPGQLRIKVAAAGIGLPDVLMCRGQYMFAPPLPFTPGQEVIGHISAIGEGVSAAIGDRVATITAFYDGYGGFAEEAFAVGESTLYEVPDSMSDVDAAGFVIPYHTAWISLVTRAHIKKGETLLVLGGAGGTGSAAIQLGAALGANVIAVAGGEQKTQRCLALGAQEAIDHTKEDFVEMVNRLTQFKGANVIFDPVGGETFSKALNCIAEEGRILPIGFASGAFGQVDVHTLVAKNCSVVGTIATLGDRQRMLDLHQDLLALYKAKKINSIVDHQVAFADIPSALTDLEARRIQGKAVALISN